MGSTKPSAGRAKPNAGKSNGGSKTFGSLSSFQPTLSFSAVPKPSARSGSALKSDSTSIEDSKRMPPPLPGTTGKKVSNGSTGSTDFAKKDKKSLNVPTKGKEKGKVEAPIIYDVDMDDGEDEGEDTPREDARYQMWADRFKPVTEAELAPGKARIAKVKDWLHTALHGYPASHTPSPGNLSQMSIDKVRKYKRILLLTGPAGAGKTTTVRVIAQEMGVELVEWNDAVEEWSLGSGLDRESPITKLSTFLSRHSFSSLSLKSELSSSKKNRQEKARALFMTSLPNLSHGGTKEAFHAALLDFCRSYSSQSSPLIIVHSDTGSGGRAEESWMQRDRGGREGSIDLLGREVKDSPWATEIDFISLAPTFVSKALGRVLQQAIPEASQRPPNSALQLIALTSHGDLRSAINSLQLLCSREIGEKGRKRKKVEDAGGVKKKGKGSRGGRGSKVDVSDDLRAVLDAVTRREQSLNLFHALGKIFYNKRLDDPNIENEDAELLAAVRAMPKEDRLLGHLSEYNRSKSLIDLEAFLPTIPVDASSFALWMHESLPSFCGEIEEASLAIDGLCCADIMKTDDDIWQSSPQAIAYALHLSVRGALLALPSPVPRRNQKVIKPQFFGSYKTERDNLVHFDHAAEYICKKAASASTRMAETPLSEPRPGVWCGLPSKGGLATEIVPMLVKLQGMSSNPLLPVSVKPLSMPSWHSTIRQDELTATDGNGPENEYEEMAAGEDGMGQVNGGGWDEEGDQGDAEEELEEEIEDFD